MPFTYYNMYIHIYVVCFRHVWGYLRLALTSLGKHELVQLAAQETEATVGLLATELGVDLGVGGDR